MNATATPAPIHDIVPPVPFFPYSLWTIILVGLGLLGLVILLIWLVKSFFSKRQKVLPTEAALKSLSLLRNRIKTISPYEFGVEASAILRRYVQEEHGLSAMTQTSLEFLESIRNNAVFSDNEKIMLGAFLETADLLKFARAKVDVEESASLLQQAEDLVKARNKDAVEKQNLLQEKIV